MKKTTSNQQKPAKKADGEIAAREDLRYARTGSLYGRAAPCIIKSSTPALSPRLWYGMPAYAKDGKVICFFRDTQKFKERYMTLGFNEEANLDEGNMWPIAFALKELTATEEAKIAELVKKAVS